MAVKYLATVYKVPNILFHVTKLTVQLPPTGGDLREYGAAPHQAMRVVDFTVHCLRAVK